MRWSLKDISGIIMKKITVKDLKEILKNVNDDVEIVCAGEEKDYFPAFIYQDDNELYLDYRPPDEKCFCCKDVLSCENEDIWSCAVFNETRKILYEGY